MIIRMLYALLLLIFICVPGVAVIYVVGAYMSCAFVDGCYAKFGVIGILESISVKEIVFGAVILAFAFALIAWPRIRNS
ncbi:hypothetical protein [Burkholderia territorii]|uniref:hypothetical protein n=1 Tax=Burkholderia territorii TaxID=1503055 RepID=UPI0012D90448|nr:hypothetical protein [Burkholderia territorii]